MSGPLPGYRPEPTVYKLNFDDTPFRGLSVKMKSVTIGQWNAMLLLAEPGESAADTVDKNNSMRALFLSKLVEWNLLGEDDQPVPMTEEGFESVDSPVISAIITAWQVALVGIPNLSQNGLSSGEISEEAGLGLGSASQSPSSWPTPN